MSSVELTSAASRAVKPARSGTEIRFTVKVALAALFCSSVFSSCALDVAGLVRS